MKIIFLLFASFLTTLAKLLSPGGIKAVLAENLLFKQQLLVLTRSRQRAPTLSPTHRMLMGFWSLFPQPTTSGQVRGLHQAINAVEMPSMPPSPEISEAVLVSEPNETRTQGSFRSTIRAIVKLKWHNPRFGCPRIALIISTTFGIPVDKHLVRRILIQYTVPESNGDGLSWLTFFGQMKDSLWSVDLFRCESIRLRSHWVLVVMDQFTRRLIGFGYRLMGSMAQGYAECSIPS